VLICSDVFVYVYAFSALTMLVGRQEELMPLPSQNPIISLLDEQRHDGCDNFA